MKNLFKTTIVIWTDYDPEDADITYLATEAADGDAYCSSQRKTFVKDPTKDPEWDGTEFFDCGKEE